MEVRALIMLWYRIISRLRLTPTRWYKGDVGLTGYGGRRTTDLRSAEVVGRSSRGKTCVDRSLLVREQKTLVWEWWSKQGQISAICDDHNGVRGWLLVGSSETLCCLMRCRL